MKHYNIRMYSMKSIRTLFLFVLIAPPSLLMSEDKNKSESFFRRVTNTVASKDFAVGFGIGTAQAVANTVIRSKLPRDLAAGLTKNMAPEINNLQQVGDLSFLSSSQTSTEQMIDDAVNTGTLFVAIAADRAYHRMVNKEPWLKQNRSTEWGRGIGQCFGENIRIKKDGNITVGFSVFSLFNMTLVDAVKRAIGL